MAEFKKESLVEGGCIVIQSRHWNKFGYLSMQKTSARFMFYCVFVNACLRKNYSACCVGIGWCHKKTADTNNRALPFGDLSNGGQVFDKFTHAISSQE